MPSFTELWWGAVAGTVVLLLFLGWIIHMVVSHHRKLLQVQRDKMEILRAAEERYKDLFNNVSDIVFIHELDGRLSQVNDVLARLLDLPPAEVQGKSVLDFLERRYHTRFYTYLDEIKKNGLSEGLISLRAPAGSKYILEYRNSLIRKDGRSVAVRGIARNVTERINAEKELRKSEHRHRRLSDLSPAPMFVCVRGKIRYANNAGLDLLGATAAPEVLGKNIDSFLAALEDSPDDASNGQIVLRESQIKRLNGEFRDVNVSAISTAYEGEEALQLVLVDVSRQKLLQKQLASAQRLETAGRLAGQIAHDFNNLLAPLTAFPAIIRQEIRSNPKVLELTHEMEASARRIAEINQQLLTLGRRGHYPMEVLDLHAVIENALDLCHIQPGTSVRINFSDEELFVRAGQAQLSRAIINLINNAMEAMKDSGSLALTTSPASLSGPLPEYDEIPAGPYVKFDIQDTGMGIKPEHLDKIFEPFFTTKPMDGQHGSGLGLSIVKNVLDDHNGYVTAESVPGKSARFTIYLPRVLDERPKPAIHTKIEPGQGECILLVDDDPLQLKVTGHFLQKIGYEVVTARSGAEAVEATLGKQPDLVILDINMRDMNGAETYREILQHRNGQKAIFLSGYAHTSDVRKGLDLGAGAFVRKPVIPYELAAAMRKELDR